MRLKLGILASGSGTNAQAMIDAVKRGCLDADIKLIFSNRKDAQVLTRAETHSIPHLCIDHKLFPNREEYDALIAGELKKYGVNTVALAGYMRLITPVFLDAFPNRVLNIHPALLPAFPGTQGAKDTWIYGAKFAGCTVHYVNPVMDGGSIIIQAAIPVRQEENDEELLNRIHAFEHRIYPQALQWLAEDRLSFDGRRVLLRRSDSKFSEIPPYSMVWPQLESGF